MPKLSLSTLKNKHFLSLTGNGVLAIFGLLQMALLYRAMSKTVVGEWFFFLTVISLCDAIRNGFLGTATVKFYAGVTKERGAEVIGSVWFLASALTGILLLFNGGAFLFVRHTNNYELLMTVRWLGLTFLSSLPYSVIFWILQADEDYGKILILRLVNNGSTIIVFGVLALQGQMSLETAMIFNFITNCFTSLVAIVWRLNTLKAISKRSKECIMELFHFGKYSLATSLSATLLRTGDVFIIKLMLGPEGVAIYNIPSKLMEIVEIPLRSFVGTGMSSMAVAFNKKDMHHVTYILKKYAGMLTVAFIPAALFVFFFADYAVLLLSSRKYLDTEAANVYRLLMLVALLYPTDRFNGITLDIIHKPKINFHKTLIMLFANTIGDLIGISIFGNVYGIVFAVTLATISGLAYGHYHLRKDVDYTLGSIFSTGIAEVRLFIANTVSKRKG